MRKSFALGVLLGVALCAIAGSGRADDKTTNSELAWKTADNCAQEAFHKFPDYTKESNLKREQYRRNCLRKKGLPAPDDPLPRAN